MKNSIANTQRPSSLEQEIVSSLCKYINKSEFDVRDWLNEFFFKENEGRGLIIQAKRHYAVLFLKKEIFEDESTRQEEERCFRQLLAFLNYLRLEGHISQTRGRSSRNTELFYIQDSFQNIKVENNRIILNSEGEYTDTPHTIQDKHSKVVYEGVIYEQDLFDLIVSCCTGKIWVSKSIRSLHKRRIPWAKYMKFSVYLVVMTLVAYYCVHTRYQIKSLEIEQRELRLEMDSLRKSVHPHGTQNDQSFSKLGFHPKADPTLIKKHSALSQPVKKDIVDTLRGIDLSHWNGSLELSKYKNMDFVVCKATGGTEYLDPNFKKNWTLLEKSPFLRGAYHFYRNDENPIAQAEYFLKVTGAFRDNDIAPVLDIEQKSIVKSTRNNRGELIRSLLQFLQYVEGKTGKTPIVYTNLHFANQYLSDKRFAEYPLWLAEYGQKEKPQVPATWKKVGWLMWQKTNSYLLQGQKLDYDIFIGDKNRLLGY